MGIHVILIECDPGNTLGGSCTRDVMNMAAHLNGWANTINIFTTSKMTSAPPNAICHKLEVAQLKQVVALIPPKSDVLVHISGHGYQRRDASHDEMDGFDEYVRTGNGILLDDDLRELFLVALRPKGVRFVGLVDTCHSGTMFDLDYTLTQSGWKVDTRRELLPMDAISIGACTDRQLDQCDVGNVGFGGSLTVHMIDTGMVKPLFDRAQVKRVHRRLGAILGKLGQSPVLQSNERF